MVKKRLSDNLKSSSKPMSLKQRDDLLIENFVGLQKAMTNLSMKFESLSDQLSQLLKVFELSAKNIVEDGPVDYKELTRKIDSLLEQNKTIAQGLVLLEGKFNQGSPGGFSRPRPLPRI